MSQITAEEKQPTLPKEPVVAPCVAEAPCVAVDTCNGGSEAVAAAKTADAAEAPATDEGCVQEAEASPTGGAVEVERATSACDTLEEERAPHDDDDDDDRNNGGNSDDAASPTKRYRLENTARDSTGCDGDGAATNAVADADDGPMKARSASATQTLDSVTETPSQQA